MATGGRSGGDSDGGSEPGVDQRRSSGRIGCRALQMVSNLSSNLGVGNEGKNPHASAAAGAQQWIDFVNESHELRPPSSETPPRSAQRFMIDCTLVEMGPFAYPHMVRDRFLDPARGNPGLDAVLEKARLKHEAFKEKFF